MEICSVFIVSMEVSRQKKLCLKVLEELPFFTTTIKLEHPEKFFFIIFFTTPFVPFIQFLLLAAQQNALSVGAVLCLSLILSHLSSLLQLSFDSCFGCDCSLGN